VDRAVVSEHRDFVERLFTYRSIGAVFEDAQSAGRRSNSEKEAWVPLAEELARQDFQKRLASETPAPQPGDWRREPKRLPTRDDLEQCFARRSQGFHEERQRVKAQLAQLGGQLDSLGGAS
jgi:hypothetical protein